MARNRTPGEGRRLRPGRLAGVHTVRAGVEPPPEAEGPFQHEGFARVLAEHVREGGVDWPALASDDQQLRAYVARLECLGPQSSPERFPARDDALAWYINAYNALVMLGVVAHWPLQSVLDVPAGLVPKRGAGFFWSQRFVLDTREVSLLGLENGIIRKRYPDARVHAALNCASASCPDLERVPFTACDLDARLTAAARRFCADPRHVRVDPSAKAIVLSTIFRWYGADFRVQARELGAGDGVLDWIAHFRAASQDDPLSAARQAGWRVRYAPYDWSLNLAPGV